MRAGKMLDTGNFVRTQTLKKLEGTLTAVEIGNITYEWCGRIKLIVYVKLLGKLCNNQGKVVPQVAF